MSLSAWHCHLDADLSFLLPGKYLLQIEQNLPIYPLPVPPPEIAETAIASTAMPSTAMAGQEKLQLGLQWWRGRWLVVLHPNAAQVRFFALLPHEAEVVSLGLPSLPEKATFPPEALAPVTHLLPAWQAAFSFLTFESYQKFCLGEVSIHSQKYAVLHPQAFFAYWLGH